MQQNRGLAWFLLIILSLIWGSSFILMKRGLEVFSSGQVAALRMGIAFLVLAPFLIRHYKVELKKHLAGMLGMGVFGSLLPAFLFTEAETAISSSLAGMLNALTPLFAVLLGVFFFGVKTGLMQLLGIALGFGGAVLLLSFTGGDDESADIRYSLLVVLATFSYAISVNMIRKYLGGLNAVTATVWAFLFVGPIALAYLFTTDIVTVMQTRPGAWNSLMYVAILGVFGTAISVILFNVLVKISDVVFASSCTYLIPIVAIVWGLFDNERIHVMQLMAIAIILGGIWLLNKKKT
jgi:drug/metabolite transporter (DMT)-like permease